jgi:hypothetical protein
MDSTTRKVILREERVGPDSRHLWAYLDGEGNLHIDGQDLGPGTYPFSVDGEYEWFQTIEAVDVPRVVELLGGAPGAEVLDLLQEGWSGERSYELERALRESAINIKRFVWR